MEPRTGTMQPILAVGLNTYPDGVVHVLPYTFGVRTPYPADSPQDSFGNHFNQGFSKGSYDAAWRVGAAGLIAGTLIGILGLMSVQYFSSPRRRY
jgi:hypothetical protein